MFDDPALPSMPPPRPDDGVKPMSIIAAAMWATGAQLLFLWVLSFTAMVREGAAYDLVGRIVCQLVGFGLALYLILRVYAPEVSIRSFVALRKSHPALYVLGLLIGVSATVPTYQLLGLIEQFYPPSEQLYQWTDLFFALSTNEKLVVAFGTVVLGPICEELLFRGAIYRPLRQKHSAQTVIVVTAVLFAVVHLDPHRIPPLFIMGCVLGYLRWASGSLVPPILMHMAFNTVPFVELMSYAEKPAADAELLPLAVEVIAGATAITLCAIALVHVIARKSRTASGARRDDET
jgi:hypothetical protein